MQTKKLNDGVEIPVYGFGTFQIPADGSTYKAVREALDLGIRHIDTAVAYFNEQEVGQAIRESGIPREIFSLYIGRTDFQFHSLIFYFTNIHKIAAETCCHRDRTIHQQIFSSTSVVFQSCVYTIEQTEIQT